MRVAVIGGSIGGLTTALVLRDVGFDVEVFERTPAVLQGRGAGIVLQPDTVRWFEEKSRVSVDQVSTSASRLRYLGPRNTIVHEQPGSYRFTSWTTIYQPLLDDLGLRHYHLGEHFVGLEQDQDGVDLRFVGGRRERAELVVFADGISSTGRRRLLPEVEPSYSGYVGWRGTVPEREITAETLELFLDSLSYVVTGDSHVNLYPIPGANSELGAGQRRMNYVWYRNVPLGPALDELLTDKRGFLAAVSVQPGQVQDHYVAELRSAAVAELPPAAAELVAKTAEPFIQTVLDIVVPRMAFGRVCLVGDAAFAARPHAAAGTAKAAADAWALGAALRDADGDVPAALAVWEPQQLALGRNLVSRVQDMGRRSQVTGTWTPGDPSLLFGLYGPGR
ncbi:MAG TPA: FAD-dependent monooxygenase [Mycobacteriales bacterium]|jgi:2,6-dihydroxypyridine 3-monooxygenase|nr:FAD-dependent monooxygenase [Mycobacteriales bacterium]